MPYTSWERASLSTPTALFGDADIATLANNVGVLSAEIDNSAGAWTHADIEALLDFATAPTGTIEFYAICAMDGTNYPAVNQDYQLTATAFGPPGSLLGVITPRGVNTVHLTTLFGVNLPVAKFKILMVNKGGYALDGTGKYVRMWRKRMKLNA